MANPGPDFSALAHSADRKKLACPFPYLLHCRWWTEMLTSRSGDFSMERPIQSAVRCNSLRHRPRIFWSSESQLRRGRKTEEFCYAVSIARCCGCCACLRLRRRFSDKRALPNLTSRLVVVRFSVTMGRIEAPPISPASNASRHSMIEPGRHETLSVSTNNDQEASVKYELTTGDEQLSVYVSEGYEVSFSRHPIKESHSAAGRISPAAHRADYIDRRERRRDP